jgi:hypothetical protein
VNRAGHYITRVNIENYEPSLLPRLTSNLVPTAIQCRFRDQLDIRGLQNRWLDFCEVAFDKTVHFVLIPVEGEQLHFCG